MLGFPVVGAEPFAELLGAFGGFEGVGVIEARVAFSALFVGEDGDVGEDCEGIGGHSRIGDGAPCGFHFFVGVDAHDFDELAEGVEGGAGEFAAVGEVAGVVVGIGIRHGGVLEDFRGVDVAADGGAVEGALFGSAG